MATMAVLPGAGEWVPLLRTAADARGHDVAVWDADGGGPGGTRVLLGPGCSRELHRAGLAVAIRHRLHHVGGPCGHAAVAEVLGGRHGEPREAGVVAVPGAGVTPLVGDLLASAGARGRPAPEEVHLSYILPEGILGPARAVPATALHLLRTPVRALVRGAVRSERTGEARRLAWFPQPIGPHHAAGVPGGEPATVPRHLPDVRTVRSYLALRGWQAEIVQAAGSLARRERGRGLLASLLGGSGVDGGEATALGAPWGCVAEITGPDGTGRAWAHGDDAAVLSAAAMVAVAERLLGESIQPGGRAPAEAADATTFLDDLAAGGHLRWSAVRPES